QAALTPLTGGPFRLFMFDGQEAMLRSVGKDRRSMVASLSQGVDVLRVEPAEDGTGGKIVGFADQGRLRVVVGHEPELPALADWRLLAVDGGRPHGFPLARLTAMWSVYSRQEGDVVAGNAAEAVKLFAGVRREYHAWVSSWRPPVAKIPFLVVHLHSKL